jgi:hypothetical protein
MKKGVKEKYNIESKDFQITKDGKYIEHTVNEYKNGNVVKTATFETINSLYKIFCFLLKTQFLY